VCSLKKLILSRIYRGEVSLSKTPATVNTSLGPAKRAKVKTATVAWIFANDNAKNYASVNTPWQKILGWKEYWEKIKESNATTEHFWWFYNKGWNCNKMRFRNQQVDSILAHHVERFGQVFSVSKTRRT
jgi:hypothetical protein